MTATGTAALTDTPILPTPTDTPVVGKVTPRADAAISSLVLSQTIGPNNRPRDPSTVFYASENYIYAFFEYHNMSNGVAWSHRWTRGDESIGGESGLWSWGSDGRAYVYFAPLHGYTPGRYEVRIYIGDHLATSATFEVK
jgi:hypothetical protein